MGKIISFEKHWNRNKKMCMSAQTAKIYDDSKTPNTLLCYIPSETSKILSRLEIENLIEMERDIRKKFEQDHKDILLSAPIYDADRIQYFAGVLLDFLPLIFHNSNCECRYKAYMDFSEFYLSEFDTAYNNFHKNFQNLEKEYLFRFPKMEIDALENALQHCLQQIISLSPTKSSKDTTELMWQACRLFELYHNIDCLFEDIPKSKSNKE